MKKAFTLAEILITLTIIGIVASITIPSLINNVYDRVWEAKREALYSRLSMALSAMPKLNGYGEFKAATTDTEAVDTAAESFIIEGLSKVFKIKTVCGADNITQCGMTHSFKTRSGGSATFAVNMKGQSAKYPNASFINTGSAYFETINGESIMVYYNPNCTYQSATATSVAVYNTMCVNFVYDLNGADTPNEAGKDIGFITAFLGPNKEIEVVAPKMNLSSQGNKTWANAISACKTLGDYRLPSMYEMGSYAVNNLIADIGMDNWTSTVYSAGVNGKAWIVNAPMMHTAPTYIAADKTSGRGTFCVEK